MADYEIRRKANIGSSSLILIFIVLCLTTFGVLSLENARREDTFSQKNAAAVQAYYRADREAEAFVQAVDQTLALADGAKQPGRDTVSSEFAIDAGLALHVELAVDWEKKTSRVQCWKVVDRGELAIDQSVPVWSGE